MATGIGVGISSVFETTVGTSVPAFSNLYSLEFDGLNDRASINDNDIFTFNTGGQDDPFSFSMWIKFAAFGAQGLLSKDAAGQSEYAIATDASGNLFFRLFDANTTTNYIQVETNASVQVVGWQHFVFTYDGSETDAGLKIYIDDVVVAQTQSTTGAYTHGMDNTTATVVYGVWGRLRSYFGGNIDEVSCWDIELSAGEVTSLYNGGTPTDLTGSTGLIGWWRNGDTAGPSVYPTIQDYSSNSNDATMYNMTSGDIVTDVP